MKAAVADRLAALSSAGCCVGLDGGRAMAVAAVWLDDAGRVCWSQLPPDDQHHVHQIAVKTAKLAADGRDVVITDAGGQVWYFAPVEEWGEIDYQAWRDVWADWQAVLADRTRRQAVQRFYAGCVGSAPPK